jgi:hypothetical protein
MGQKNSWVSSHPQYQQKKLGMVAWACHQTSSGNINRRTVAQAKSRTLSTITRAGGMDKVAVQTPVPLGARGKLH